MTSEAALVKLRRAGRRHGQVMLVQTIAAPCGAGGFHRRFVPEPDRRHGSATRDPGARCRGRRGDRLDADLLDAGSRLRRGLPSGPVTPAMEWTRGGAGGRRRRPRPQKPRSTGLALVGATSAVVNVGIKPLQRRRPTDRVGVRGPDRRHVEMPLSTSFPSGHAASAFAFATGVTRDLPTVGIPLHAAAAVVAYSRVHTGCALPDRRHRRVGLRRLAVACRDHGARPLACAPGLPPRTMTTGAVTTPSPPPAPGP